jgi:hypothetical protein
MKLPKVKLTTSEGVRRVRIPEDWKDNPQQAPYAIADGACPHCKAEPFKVAGARRRISSDDRAYEADGGCIACEKFVGILRQETNTLFGLREDEAMSRLGIRIY